ncbi:hypothetical protein GQ53DRAFT_835248 [Thozetella sp. PMI_491]|nr:hypothetical protein GQ53DRAFT_835248 [Thozetella sp. PMI_491]
MAENEGTGKEGKGPRRRAWAPKSKGGCGTCKIRHKRCDEGRPICENCRTTGRVCDGYIDLVTGRRSGGHASQATNKSTLNILHRAVPSSPLFASQQEAQGFRFFETGTAFQLGHSLADHSWALPVLQLGHQDPAIRHALISLGTMSKRYEADQLLLASIAEAKDLHQQSLEHYAKSTLELRRRLSTGVDQALAPESALALTLLLALLGILHGDEKLVLVQAEHAVRIATALGTRGGDQGFVQLSQLLDMTVAFWLNRDRAVSDVGLQFQALYTSREPTLGFDMQTLGNDLSTVGLDVMTLRHATVCSRAHIRDNHSSRESIVSTLRQIVAAKKALDSRLDYWRSVFPEAISADDLDTPYRRNVLEVNYIFTRLMLDDIHASEDLGVFMASEIDGELDTRSTERFRAIVELTEAHMTDVGIPSRYDMISGERELQPTGLLPIFSFRLSFIRPLLFVAQRAPQRSLRSRAIQLLLSRPWREGAWDSTALGLIAKRALESESST